jgi:hypothetical protein
MTKGEKPSALQVRDDALRAVLRSITATDHEGVQRRTAKALDVPVSTLNGYVNGREGNSTIGDAVAVYLGRTVDEIVAAGGDLAALRRPTQRATDVKFGALPMWASLLAGAKALAPDIPEWCWADTADSVVWLRGPITAGTVVAVARVILEHTPPHG